MSACFVACFAVFAPQILHLFIPEAQTSSVGAQFLRVACLAVPLTSVNFLISYTLQAMGKKASSLHASPPAARGCSTSRC